MLPNLFAYADSKQQQRQAKLEKYYQLVRTHRKKFWEWNPTPVMVEFEDSDNAGLAYGERMLKNREDAKVSKPKTVDDVFINLI